MNKQQFLRHQQSIEREIHQVWMPHAGQIPIAQELFINWLQGVFLRCGRKFGKALALDTPVATPSGFVPIGDIESGDLVFDENGHVQTVLVAHDVIDNPESYRIHFCNGTHIDACADHRWLTWTKRDRKNERRGLRYSPSVKSTKEIFQTQMCGKEYNHSIPYSDVVKYEKVETEIDPYVLGCWLGDGNSQDARFSSIDDEILERISEVYSITKLSGDNCDYYIRGLQSTLREIGVLGNKHIPDNYIFNSIPVRYAILQGLMDTDGTINKNGNHCCFDNTNKALADGVFKIVASLGMKPIMKTKKTSHKLCYRVMFRPLSSSIFWLSRKRDRINLHSIKHNHHTIKKVEKIDSKPMRCLTVSGESKLFLVGESMIPTHNTEFAIYCMYLFGLIFENSECYYVADEKDHARDICWDNRRLPEFFTTFRQQIGESTEDFLSRKKKGRELQNRWVKGYNNSEMIVRLHNGSVLKVDGAKNYSKADGLSPTFVVYDEFKHHDPRYDTAMRPNLRALNGRILIIGTPPDNEDNYYCKTEIEFQNKKNHIWFKRPSHMNPHVYDGPDDESLKEEEAAYRRKNEYHVFQREYMCEIVPDQERQIFPMFEVPPRNHTEQRFEGETSHVRTYSSLIADVNHRQRDFDFYVCFDAGSAVCFGVLFIAINRHDKRCIVLDEIYETNQMNTSTGNIYPRASAIMDEIHLFRADWYQIYDHAATWFAVEVANQYDEALMPCQKDTKKKEVKLSMIKDIMLEDGLFLVSDRCQNFISEISKYAKDENGRIPKENDHLIDCLRYILNESNYYTLFEEYREQKSGRRYETPETDIEAQLRQHQLLGADYDY